MSDFRLIVTSAFCISVQTSVLLFEIFKILPRIYRSQFLGIEAIEVKTNETSSSVEESALKESTHSLRRQRTQSGDTLKNRSSEIIDSWTWGNCPSEEKLRQCLEFICYEQQKMCGDAAGTTLYSYRFRQRSTVLKRYYIAQCRSQKLFNNPKVVIEDKNVEELSKKPKEKKQKNDTQGLARLGSRAALSFAFAFLRRAWRNGEDSDLCTELLQETLGALTLLPPPSLFDEDSVSSVWLEVVERTSKFLRSVVMNQDDVEIPSKDRNTALTLLLEFAVQKGSLHEILDMVKLLLTIWSLGRERLDNRTGFEGKILQRIFKIQN